MSSEKVLFTMELPLKKCFATSYKKIKSYENVLLNVLCATFMLT